MGNLLIVLAILGLTSCGVAYGRNVIKERSEAQYKTLYMKFMADKKLERPEIEEMLANLPDALDRDLNFGAMCYEAVTIPLDHLYYICPVCSKRTAYPTRGETRPEWELINLVSNIDAFRRQVKKVKGFDIRLDERQFCHKCNPGVKTPQLSLKVRLDKGATVLRTENISLEDLNLLTEFSNGGVVHKGERDVETLLSAHSDRLKKLLGITDQ